MRLSPLPLLAGASLLLAAAAPAPEPVLPLKEFMGHVMQRNATQVWAWTAWVSDAHGERYTSPATAKDWEDAESDALTLAELTDRLTIPDRRPDPDWDHYAAALRNAATASAEAADHHDFPALLTAGNAIDAACVACHRHYVPQLEDAEPREPGAPNHG